TEKPEEHETPPDTTQLRFISAYGNVRIYRTDIQARCDSMAFSQIDTLMKLFKDPVVWNEGIHQLTGETMLFMMKDGAFDRGCMQGGAMIISMEDTVHFNQVKSTEMLGYFNSDNQLRRYDALGGVNALFYVREDSVITVMNSKEAQFMMVTLKNGAAQRLKYYETVKSDAYPVADLAIEKQRLKGFNWRDAERPKDRFEITGRKLRKSRRDLTKSTAMPTFPRANDYYAGYMTDIYKQIADRAEAARLEMLRRDSLEQVRQMEEAMAHIDSTMGIAGTVSKEGDVLIDSLATPPTPTATVAEKAVSPIDSLMAEERPKESKAKSKKVVIETPASQEIAEVELVQTPSEDKKLTRSERKALRKAARQLKREQRKARRLMRKAPIPETQQ
ncbi:MAG: hypothetical protein HUJ91_07315, partial [Bacteroidales bacterium]|nr:hypothetical protein [Bacteroidales bacterium]